jgi:hypothetical protein
MRVGRRPWLARFDEFGRHGPRLSRQQSSGCSI